MRERKKSIVIFHCAVLVKCRESDLLDTLLLKMATQRPKTSFINHSFRPPKHHMGTCWCTSRRSADKVVRCTVMRPHRRVIASLSGCERRALCSCSLWHVPLVVSSRSHLLIPGTSQNTALLTSLAGLPYVINLQSNQYDMATRIHGGILTFILRVHTRYLLSTIIPPGPEPYEEKIWRSGYGQQWWHLIWVMVTRQPQAEWAGVGLLIVS